MRVDGSTSDAQAQTADVFGFKWQQRETFESAQAESAMRSWLVERYGNIEKASWWDEYGERPLVLDAGCGAGRSAVLLFGDRLRARARYLGADISEAVDAARDRFVREGLEGGYLQCDLLHLPLPPESVNVIFSEGVLHHTDSTRAALLSIAKLLRPGGRILFYVYRRKGPLREFADDFIRAQLQELRPGGGLGGDEAFDQARAGPRRARRLRRRSPRTSVCSRFPPAKLISSVSGTGTSARPSMTPTLALRNSITSTTTGMHHATPTGRPPRTFDFGAHTPG